MASSKEGGVQTDESNKSTRQKRTLLGSSPTVAIESVMLSCTVDAKEYRDVGIVDIPNAFMQVDMDDTVHVKLKGKMAELLVKIDPKLYRPYVLMENRKPVMFMELRKALYGTLKAALLFWKRLSSQLIKWNFELNPYNICVANKMIKGNQCTILWYVDDLKISHVDTDVVTEVIELLESEFGKEATLTKSRGKVHEYLGMVIDYSIPGKVMFTMIDFIKDMLNDLPKDMDGTVPTPAASHQFEVDESATKLGEDVSMMYHHNTAKFLFLCKRARPDTQPHQKVGFV
jgi:Reverse transcriptase (RNA-dependent DNA polymerase)